MSKKSEQSDVEQELEFDEQELESVKITDDAIDDTDKTVQKARRRAKKEYKKYRTPDEKKRARRKKDLIILACLLVIVGVLLIIPTTRWPILNAIGFRSKLVITVVELKSQKPIEGAEVVLASGRVMNTDGFGHATFANTRLGKQTATISKTGYGIVTTEFHNGFGKSSTHTINLKIVGIKLDVIIKDWLSSRPLSGATVSFGENKATSDNSGLASIVIPPTDEDTVTLEVVAPGYMAKPVKTEVAVSSREVSLVLAHKNYFISKRDGKFDIFATNLDGSGQVKIIEATGKESEQLLQFSINRNNQQAVLVANRDGRVQNNRIVAGVYIVDLTKSTLRKVDEGSDVQLLGWVDDTIAYSKTTPELNYDDPGLTKLQTYNLAKSSLATIAQSNYLQIGIAAQNKVFYMPADSYRSIEGSVLTSFDIVTGARRTYLPDKQLAYATRPTFGTIEIQDSSGANHELVIATGAIKSIDRQPSTELQFALKPGGGQVVWTDRRDGQGALLVRSTGANDERVVARAGGLTSPARYIGESHAVVRIATSAETADYVVDLATGKFAKIVDVSNFGGVRSVL